MEAFRLLEELPVVAAGDFSPESSGLRGAGGVRGVAGVRMGAGVGGVERNTGVDRLGVLVRET